MNSVDLLPSLEGRVGTGGRLNVGRAALLVTARDAPPQVLASLPPDSGFDPVSMVRLYFSKPMDRASVEAGFSAPTEAPGIFEWSNADHVVTFRPDTPWPVAELLITFRLSGDVLDAAGAPIDGNANRIGEGSPTDDYIWSYQLLPAALTSFEPAQNHPGGRVYLYGMALDTVAAVRFDGMEAMFLPNRNVPGGLIAVVPEYATTGPLTLESFAGTSTSETAFVVLSPQRPALDCARESSTLVSFTWPAAAHTTLETATALHPATWVPVETAPVLTGEVCRLTISIEDDHRFYRLSRTPGEP